MSSRWWTSLFVFAVISSRGLGCSDTRPGGQTGSELSCIDDSQCVEALGDWQFCDETSHCAPVPSDFVPLAPHEACDRMLKCADKQSPSQFGDFFPVYGTNGSCWQDQAEPECRKGCVDVLNTLYDEVFPDCNYCDTPTTCPSIGSSYPGVCRDGPVSNALLIPIA